MQIILEPRFLQGVEIVITEAVKHGADFLPKEWDTKNQKWLVHDNISEKKRYTNRGGK